MHKNLRFQSKAITPCQSVLIHCRRKSAKEEEKAFLNGSSDAAASEVDIVGGKKSKEGN